MSIPNPRRLGVALLLLAAGLAWSRPGQAFEVYRHANMAGEVLATQGVPGVALRYIKQGCRLPDLDGCRQHCYCPSWLQWMRRLRPTRPPSSTC